MYQFGTKSSAQLQTLHPALQKVVEKALSYGVLDFSVIEGFRPVERQKQLFREGKSHINGVTKFSKHQSTPSLAVDILPFPAVINGVNVWQDRQRFSVLAGLMYAAASELGVLIRWGGDWDGDGNNADSNFHDLPHFELMGLPND